MTSPSAQQPTALGPYRVLATIGQGGMGVVYRAEHEEFHTPAAVKTVRIKNENLLAGIRREIRALMRVDHPGVVRILGEGISDGIPWYAMELLEGETLRDHLKHIWSSVAGGDTFEAETPLNQLRAAQRSTLEALTDPTTLGRSPILRSQPLPAAGGRLSEALAPLKQLCEALAFLHGEGIVHRDLKPENVFLRADHSPVLMDFGVMTQFSGSSGREVLEISGLSTGTAGYMAPEQIHGERVDARADLYAVGCMLYEVVVGLQPFVGLTGAMLQHHLVSDVVRPSELVTGLPVELEELIMRLLAKRPRDRLGHAHDVIEVLRRYCDAPAVGGPPTRDYLYRPELVGRQEATDTLAGHLEAARDGRGALILVAGESGVGKTTVAVEASRLAAVRGLVVKTGECLAVAAAGDRSLRAAPFHPLRDLLTSFHDRVLVDGPIIGKWLLGERGKILAAIEPRLGQLPGVAELPDPPELPAEAARWRLLHALTDTLTVAASERPLLLLLDDLQWADELTLAWLRSLQPAILSHGLVVLGTFRLEELSPPLEELAKTAGIVVIELGRLPDVVVGAMVTEMLSLAQPPRDFIEFLVQNSEGNPFFIAEYLHAAVAGKYLLRDDDGRWQVSQETSFADLALPRTLHDLVARRLDGLSATARRLCEAASVLGRAFDGDLPRVLAGLTDLEVVEAIDQIVARTIFEIDESGRLFFQHDKLREIAYAMIDPARLPELHDKAAQAISERHQDDLDQFLPSLAHHFERAGRIDRAIEYLEKAGQQLLGTAAHGDAAYAFARALFLDERLATRVSSRRRARWEHGLGQARFALGDLSGAEKHARLALTELGHPPPSSGARWELFCAKESAKQAAHRVGILGRARDRETQNDLIEAAQSAGLLAHRSYYVGDPLALLCTALLSVNLAEEAELGWQVPNSYSWLGYAVGLFGQERLARGYFARAQEGARRRQRRPELAFARTIEALGHIGFARLTEAASCLHNALGSSGSDAQTHELTLSALGHLEFHQGKVELALERNQALHASARARNHPQHVAWALAAQARSLIKLGRFGDAELLLSEARRILSSLYDPDWLIACLGLSALAQLRKGDHVRAHDFAADAEARMTGARPIGCAVVDGYDAVAEVFLTLEERERAARAVSSLARLERRFPLAAPFARHRAAQLKRMNG